MKVENTLKFCHFSRCGEEAFKKAAGTGCGHHVCRNKTNFILF